MRLLDFMFDRTVSGLNKAMDLSWRRNQVITANIANAETPKYRAGELQFGKELDRAFNSQKEEVLMKTDGKHLELQRDSSARTAIDYSGITRADGNNVDIDQQMANLAQNSSDYANAAQLIRRQIGVVRMAIRDSR
jgi:flagellar basal-body rod protein FlgB